MNKRVVLAAAGILLVASLASCGRNSGDATTVPALTGATQSTLGNGQQLDSSAALVATTAGNASPTYILTTQQGQTMATVPLTAFSLDTTTPTSTVSIPDLGDITSPSLDNPNVLTSVMPTLPSTSPLPTVEPSTSGAITTQKQTTTTKPTTTEPTTAAQKSSMTVIPIGDAYSDGGNLDIDIDPEGWGGIARNSGYVTVYIDGKKYSFVKASVNGTPDDQGNITITVNIGGKDYEHDTTSSIKVEFPSGFITSKDGTKSSNEFSYVRGTLTAEE